MVDLTPSLAHTSCMTFEANCGPRSDITWCGNPVRRQTLSIYSLAVSSAVIVLVHGVTMVALLRRSTTTNSESYPWEMGRSVMKSMVIIPQTSVGTGVGCRGTWVLGRILVA